MILYDVCHITVTIALTTLTELTPRLLINHGPIYSLHYDSRVPRYLFQVLLEAGCLEWSFLLATVLRDCADAALVFGAALASANQMARSTNSDAMLLRMRDGICRLTAWVDTNWLTAERPSIARLASRPPLTLAPPSPSLSIGYRPFLSSIESQITGFNNCVENLKLKSANCERRNEKCSSSEGFKVKLRSTATGSERSRTTSGVTSVGDIATLEDFSPSEGASDCEGL